MKQTNHALAILARLGTRGAATLLVTGFMAPCGLADTVAGPATGPETAASAA